MSIHAGERAARGIELEHDDLVRRPTTPRRARPRSSSCSHRRARRCPRSGLSPRSPVRRLVGRVGGRLDGRLGEHDPNILGGRDDRRRSRPATSTDSDWRPSALVVAIGKATTTAVDHRRVGRRRSRSASPGHGRDHELYRDPLAQTDGQRTFVDLDGDDGVARSDERVRPARTAAVTNEPDTRRTLAYEPTSESSSSPRHHVDRRIGASTSTVRSMSLVICAPAGTSTMAWTAGSSCRSDCCRSRRLPPTAIAARSDTGRDAVPPTARRVRSRAVSPRGDRLVGSSPRHAVGRPTRPEPAARRASPPHQSGSEGERPRPSEDADGRGGTRGERECRERQVPVGRTDRGAEHDGQLDVAESHRDGEARCRSSSGTPMISAPSTMSPGGTRGCADRPTQRVRRRGTRPPRRRSRRRAGAACGRRSTRRARGVRRSARWRSERRRTPVR